MRKKEIYCAECGEPVPPQRLVKGPPEGHVAGRPREDGTRRSRARRYCSDACRRAHANGSHRELLRTVEDWRLCEWCHALFLTDLRRRRFCSYECGFEWGKAEHRAKMSRARAIREGRVAGGR